MKAKNKGNYSNNHSQYNSESVYSSKYILSCTSLTRNLLEYVNNNNAK